MADINIMINSCNNLISGQITLEKNKLNIKYGLNGTGKSTIASGLELLSKGESLISLKTFGSSDKNAPEIQISENLSKVLVFNEQFVNTIVFDEDKVIKDSFQVFIKTSDYDQRRKELNNRLKALKVDVGNDERVLKLRQDMQNLAGKLELNASGDELKNNVYLKAVLKKDNLFKIPATLQKYTPLLTDDRLSIGWIDWKTKGEQYDTKGICPFCSEGLAEQYSEQKEIFKNTYKKADSQNLKNMLDYFQQFEKYMEPSKYKSLIECIKKNIDEDSIRTLLTSFTLEFQYIKTRLDQIEQFDSLVFKNIDIKDLDKFIDALLIQKVNINFFQSSIMIEILDFINGRIELLSQEAAKLKADMGTLKTLMNNTIKNCQKDINGFLESSGISYEVILNVVDENETNAILRYKKNENSYEVKKIRNHLSWGERNAFALVLFMYYAISQNPDLIVLDDPISSFDYNKKYAIIHRLFARPKNGVTKSFYRMTVLMLTHDFEPIIDFVVVGKLPSECVKASYLKNNKGTLEETYIDKKHDIRPFIQELMYRISDTKLNMVSRIAFLRKYYEHHGIEGHMEAYDILSSLIHGRNQATNFNGDILDATTLTVGLTDIEQYITDFDYNYLIQNYFNEIKLVGFYLTETNNYLKIQLFRALMEVAPIEEVETDDPLMKFINESYHIENDSVYYLDLFKFDFVPSYIIEKINTHISRKYSREDVKDTVLSGTRS